MEQDDDGATPRRPAEEGETQEPQREDVMSEFDPEILSLRVGSLGHQQGDVQTHFP